MVLIKDLINFLNEEEEPLEKRLKVANNAYTSSDLYSPAKETYLLQWITNITNSSVDAWKLFGQWLNSEHFKKLTKIDLSQDCIKKIYKVVTEKLKSENYIERKIAISSSFEIINNPIFHEYFKLNLKNYFSFLCQLLETIDNKDQISSFVNNESILKKNYRTSDKFYKYFFELLLPKLSEINLKHGDDHIFKDICVFIQKYILQKNFKLFDDSLQHFFEGDTIVKHSVMEYLLNSLLNLYTTSIKTCTCFINLFFNAVCHEYCNSPLFVYKLSVVLFQTLGFNLSEVIPLCLDKKITDFHFDNSLKVLVSIFQTLATFKNELNLKIKEITFSQLLELLILTIINLSGVPNNITLKILYYCIDMDPLIVDKKISEILEYLLLRKNCYKTEYIQLCTLIFKVFTKLHRVQNLISKMLLVLRQQLCNELKSTPNKIQFIGIVEQQDLVYEYDVENMFPEEVLNSFVDCVGDLASWQVINVFKTFLFHLGLSIEHDLQDKSILIYIEVIGVFLCQFLSSVRIAEHTVPDFVVNKFVNAMEELKNVLNKFGNILITMEHDHVLMRTFLNICYTWGDLYMILSYYSSNVNMLLNETRNQDHFLVNISYIHSYLTAAQWSLISERVNNFGEPPCKQLMQSLYIQHIKAVLLFEKTLSEDMVMTLINNFMLSLDDLWPCIVHDSFTMNNIVPKMHSSQILALTDVVIKNMFVQTHVTMFSKIVRSEVMLRYLVYNILLGINKTLKPKKTSRNLPMSTKIFNEFREAFSECSGNSNIFNKLLVTFNGEQIQNEVGLKINNEKLFQYLEMLSKIPVIMADDFRLCTALYLLAVLNDLRSIDKNDSINTKYLEKLLTGILQITTKSLAISLTPENAVHYLVKNITNYKKIFKYFIESLYIQGNYVTQLEDISDCLLQSIGNKKYEDCLSILLFSMMKQRKRKICLEHKSNITLAIQKISKKVTEFITTENTVSLSLYAHTLKISLACHEQNVQDLKKYLNNYTEIALKGTTETSSNEEAILLLSTILHNTSKFEIVDDNFLLEIWRAYKNTETSEEYVEDKRKLVILIFEHISNENFEFLTDDILTNTIYLRNDNAFINYIDIWTNILSCNFNQTKSVMWIQIIQSLLQKLLLIIQENNILAIQKKILEFQIQLTQAVHVHLTSCILDTMFLTISHCTAANVLDLHSLCTKVLDALLRYRKPLITDRLPSFLQPYRSLLQHVCKISNSNMVNGYPQDLEKSAHNLEMLTKNLVSYGKHISRITPYLIADILAQFETINLIPEVKMHLENCIYSLLQLCDQHAVSYLMRSLSIPSTEIFKFIYENYNKFYRYKGKV